MNRIPIRIRLTLIFAVGMAIVLAAVGLFVYLRVASDLGNAFDKDLRSRGQALSALVQSGRPVLGPRPADTFAEVVAPGGRVGDATPDLGKHLLLSGTDLARATRGASLFDLSRIPGQDESGRMLALALQGRVLVVGATLEHRNDTLTSLQAAFLIGGPVALLLMSIGGYLLAGAALRRSEERRVGKGESAGGRACQGAG